MEMVVEEREAVGVMTCDECEACDPMLVDHRGDDVTVLFLYHGEVLAVDNKKHVHVP